jgi:hypothetical protein
MVARPYANRSNEYLKQVRDQFSNDGDESQLNAIAELEYRQQQEDLRKMQADIQKLTIPHWTRSWTFYLVVASLIVALAALALQWRADIRDSKSSNVFAPVSSPSTTMTPSSPPISTQKKSGLQHKPVQKKP